MMILLPPAIVLFFIYRDPAYLTKLMDSTWGFRSMVMAIFLQIIGSFAVLRILQSSKQT